MEKSAPNLTELRPRERYAREVQLDLIEQVTNHLEKEPETLGYALVTFDRTGRAIVSWNSYRTQVGMRMLPSYVKDQILTSIAVQDAMWKVGVPDEEPPKPA